MTDIIEVMARVTWELGSPLRSGKWDRLDGNFRLGVKEGITIALKAAKAEGWELCRLPEQESYNGYVPPEDGEAAVYWDSGFEECLDKIQRLELRIKTQTEQPLLVELKRLRALNADLLERAYREGWQDGYDAKRLGLSDSEQETAKDWDASDTRQSLEESK